MKEVSFGQIAKYKEDNVIIIENDKNRLRVIIFGSKIPTKEQIEKFRPVNLFKPGLLLTKIESQKVKF